MRFLMIIVMTERNITLEKGRITYKKKESTDLHFVIWSLIRCFLKMFFQQFFFQALAYVKEDFFYHYRSMQLGSHMHVGRVFDSLSEYLITFDLSDFLSHTRFNTEHIERGSEKQTKHLKKLFLFASISGLRNLKQVCNSLECGTPNGKLQPCQSGFINNKQLLSRI